MVHVKFRVMYTLTAALLGTLVDAAEFSAAVTPRSKRYQIGDYRVTFIKDNIS